jgi:hypothetical protein
MRWTAMTSTWRAHLGLVHGWQRTSPPGRYGLIVDGCSLPLREDAPHQEDHTQRSAVMLLVLCHWSQIGVK